MIKEVRDHITKGDNYHVLLRVKAKLGYENVFRVLYDHLGVKVSIQLLVANCCKWLNHPELSSLSCTYFFSLSASLNRIGLSSYVDSQTTAILLFSRINNRLFCALLFRVTKRHV